MADYKIDKLIKQMTLKEKIGMIHGSGLFRNGGVERLGIPPLKMSDGPMGVRQEFDNSEWTPKNNDDYVTYLPSGSAIASSWNPDLAYRYGLILGAEARARDKDVILAPSVNIIRSPLCGRNFEYLSEDPFLAKTLAVSMVQGIQENDVAACVKHFIANNQETNRLRVDAIVSQKTLEEIYFPAFKAAIQEGKALAVMGAYNKLNGEHCSQSKTLLNTVLRENWHFDNIVISDWSAVNDTIEAANSGIDIEMSVTNNFDEYFLANPLIRLVEKGLIKEEVIDEKVRNILKVMFKLKILGSDDSRAKGSQNTKEHQKTAYDIATETIVLLKNEGRVLPISKNIKKLLIIGENARAIHANGGGSAEIKALYEITPLEALKNKLGEQCQIDFIPGYLVSPQKGNESKHWQETSLETKEDDRETISRKIMEERLRLRQEAATLAKEYDNVIIFGGLNHLYDVEAQDRSSLDLPYEQDELIEAVLRANPNTIIHILSGACINMRRWSSRAKAIIWSSYNGMEGGNALSDVILGNNNPSGKLAQTFADELSSFSSHSIGEFPGNDKVHYREETDVGYRHFLKNGIKPSFGFGHGLSYTSFEYGDFSYSPQKEKHIFAFTIANTGDFDGMEITQLYVTFPKNNKIRELKRFKKTAIGKHTKAVISITLLDKDLEKYDESSSRFKIEEGEYQVAIASSLYDIKHVFSIKIDQDRR